jgi:CRP/FNR family transcriptional regulator, cyclic AMP receptor protein
MHLRSSDSTDAVYVLAMESARLASIGLFAGLSEDELDAVARRVSEREIESGEAVASEGDFGHALFAIESGTAKIVRGEETIRTVGPGDVVGEIAVLVSGRRTASVVATGPMRLIVLFKRDVWALEREAPEAASRLRELVDEHLQASGSQA